MKKLYCTVLLCSLIFSCFAQSKTDKLTEPIVAEGKLLYRSEMASWYGTDIFLEKYKNRENVGGYFSYPENDKSVCVFFSRAENPTVIGTVIFDSSYNTKTAGVDLVERSFSDAELSLFTIRNSALKTVQSDTLFETYENSNLNIIPIISGGQKKVYVLTGPKQSGVVLFGNDYLLTYDNNNKLLTKRRLHKSLIPIEYGKQAPDGSEITGAIHTHLPETGDFITATDICTLMLYEKFTQWKQHQVVSRNYVSIWNCETDELLVLTRKAVERIMQHQEKKRE